MSNSKGIVNRSDWVINPRWQNSKQNMWQRQIGKLGGERSDVCMCVCMYVCVFVIVCECVCVSVSGVVALFTHANKLCLSSLLKGQHFLPFHILLLHWSGKLFSYNRKNMATTDCKTCLQRKVTDFISQEEVSFHPSNFVINKSTSINNPKTRKTLTYLTRSPKI